jgi:ATPase subunit of ABC transporter with duplicated ATPase domains
MVCVSHDRYFLDHVVSRMLIIEPPAVIDFDGGYSAWTQKQAAQAAAETQRKADAAKQKNKPEPKPAAKQALKQTDKRADNPYMRPFGRLSVQDIETQITETEIALADCQQAFGDPAFARDAGKMRHKQKQADELAKKLKQLEEEYFLRGE